MAWGMISARLDTQLRRNCKSWRTRSPCGSDDRAAQIPVLLHPRAVEPLARAPLRAADVKVTAARAHGLRRHSRSRERIWFIRRKLDDERVVADAVAEGFEPIRRRRGELVGHEHLRITQRSAMASAQEPEGSIALADHRGHAVDRSSQRQRWRDLHFAIAGVGIHYGTHRCSRPVRLRVRGDGSSLCKE